MEQTERAKYKQRLLEMCNRLTGEINQVEEEVRQDVSAVGELSNVPIHPADRDVEMLDSNLAAAASGVDVLNGAAAALQRIEEGTFGQCVDCGREISPERLDALPQTPYCIHCARRHDRRRAADESAEPPLREFPPDFGA
jgi:RNA polymerase-binding transcription factor DksA